MNNYIKFFKNIISNFNLMYDFFNLIIFSFISKFICKLIHPDNKIVPDIYIINFVNICYLIYFLKNMTFKILNINLSYYDYFKILIKTLLDIKTIYCISILLFINFLVTPNIEFYINPYLNFKIGKYFECTILCIIGKFYLEYIYEDNNVNTPLYRKSKKIPYVKKYDIKSINYLDKGNKIDRITI